jgi:SecY interacting protein Syd
MSDFYHSLNEFSLRYKQAYESRLGDLPQFYCGQTLQQSPCVVNHMPDGLATWQPVPRVDQAHLQNLAQALETPLPEALEDYYLKQYAANMGFDSPWGAGELLQCWDEEDVLALQENLIGHVLMKQRLKQEVTFFIGILHDQEERLISLKADHSGVFLETVGRPELVQIAANLPEFLNQLSPWVGPPAQPIKEVEVSKPTIWSQIIGFWRPK